MMKELEETVAVAAAEEKKEEELEEDELIELEDEQSGVKLLREIGGDKRDEEAGGGVTE